MFTWYHIKFFSQNRKKQLLFSLKRYRIVWYLEAWLSLVERCVRDAEVACSNHVASTLLKMLGISGFQAFFYYYKLILTIFSHFPHILFTEHGYTITIKRNFDSDFFHNTIQYEWTLPLFLIIQATKESRFTRLFLVHKTTPVLDLILQMPPQKHCLTAEQLLFSVYSYISVHPFC